MKTPKTIGAATDLLTDVACMTALGYAEKAILTRNGKIRDYDEDHAVRLLAARMEYLFQHSKTFHKSLMSKANQGNAGRDNLLMWATHWGQSLVDARPIGRTLYTYEASGEGLLFINYPDETLKIPVNFGNETVESDVV